MEDNKEETEAKEIPIEEEANKTAKTMASKVAKEIKTQITLKVMKELRAKIAVPPKRRRRKEARKMANRSLRILVEMEIR